MKWFILTLFLASALLSGCSAEHLAEFNAFANGFNQGANAATGNQASPSQSQPYSQPPVSEAPQSPILQVWNELVLAESQSTGIDQNGQRKMNFIMLADKLVLIDCTSCPQEFQDAWAKFVQAVTQFGSHYNIISGIAGTLDLLRGNPKELARFNDEYASVQADQLECERIGTQHGVIFKN